MISFKFQGILNYINICLASAKKELFTHGLRSFLSVIGILAGVASFVVMISLSEMNKAHIQNFLNEIGGLNRIDVWPKQAITPEEEYEFMRSPGSKYCDVDSIYNSINGLEYAYKRRVQFQLHFYIKNEDYLCGFAGVTKHFQKGAKVLGGRLISEDEFHSGKAVCLLPNFRLAKFNKDFGWSIDDIIGKTLYVNGVNAVKIIGIIDKPSLGYDWFWYRNALIVPLNYMEKEVEQRPTDGFMSMGVKADAGADLINVQAKISRKLKMLHRGVEDFEFSNKDWIKEVSENSKKANSAFLVITVLCLLVGGLNVMNVMLASISTRIKEIGLRQALGATRSQIFFQFLSEAVLLSVIGGLLGSVAGFFLSDLAAKSLAESMPGVNHNFKVEFAMLGICVSILSGIVFGLYPAIKTIKMNTVTALYHE